MTPKKFTPQLNNNELPNKIMPSVVLGAEPVYIQYTDETTGIVTYETPHSFSPAIFFTADITENFVDGLDYTNVFGPEVGDWQVMLPVDPK